MHLKNIQIEAISQGMAQTMLGSPKVSNVGPQPLGTCTQVVVLGREIVLIDTFSPALGESVLKGCGMLSAISDRGATQHCNCNRKGDDGFKCCR
jgi:hypothetical protein